MINSDLWRAAIRDSRVGVGCSSSSSSSNYRSVRWVLLKKNIKFDFKQCILNLPFSFLKCDLEVGMGLQATLITLHISTNRKGSIFTLNTAI